jgi:acyl-CoA synthetase (AMP-forming)/AMP-acid ligase II
MNIAQRIEVLALEQPQKKATLFPKRSNLFGVSKYSYQNLNFETLNKRASQYAEGLLNAGLKPGDKTLLFIKPCLEFHALVFALFKAGIVPVLIDPGMGRKNLMQAIQDVKPKGLIAEPIIHLIKLFYPEVFSSIQVQVSNRSIPFTNIHNFYKWEQLPGTLKAKSVSKNELAAILFTSGGTGKPKGVEYTHTIFDQQTSILQEMFSLSHDDVDLPGFPLFSLFTLAMGMSSCVPDMNPSKPASCNPKKLVQNIIDTSSTFLAGSPAIWLRVGKYCQQESIQLPSVKCLAMFGAPVSNELHRIFERVLPNGTTYTPYGATESLPVSNISGKQVLNETAQDTDKGQGTCVGQPAPHIQIKIIPISDAAISDISQTPTLPPMVKGEIIVNGGVVTAAYHKESRATGLAKISDSTTARGFWHRMGDIGYLDHQGRLWFCGRKSHRVETEKESLYPTPIESVFNNHPMVQRSALIGIGEYGKQIPAIVIQPNEEEMFDVRELKLEIAEFAKENPMTQKIQKIYLKETLPVDIRHNIKIDRLKLKSEAEGGRL